MAKSIEKTEKLISGYQVAECVVSVVQRQKPWINGPKEKVWYVSKKILLTFSDISGMSGELFLKQPLRGLVENGVLKILAKPLKNSCEGVRHI